MSNVKFRYLGVFLLLLGAALPACGTEDTASDDDVAVVDAAGDAGTGDVSGDPAAPDVSGDTSPDTRPDGSPPPDTSPDTGPVACEEPNPAGCRVTGCPEGELCLRTAGIDECMPSSCFCDEETGVWVCTEDCGEPVACRVPDTGRCEEPNPAGCYATGCPGEEQCLPIPEAQGCQPSGCFCDPVHGWGCTDDCRPPASCRVPDPEVCPAAEPQPGASCDAPEGTNCGWGQECCCGECHPSFGCVCSGGTWACYATDACMVPSCEGRACDADSDCSGGLATGAPERCIEGICRDGRMCGTIEAADACEANPLCEYLRPGCSDESTTTLPAACRPGVDCAQDWDCPGGMVCRTEVAVAVDCERCDACAQIRGVCVED